VVAASYVCTVLYCLVRMELSYRYSVSLSLCLFTCQEAEAQRGRERQEGGSQDNGRSLLRAVRHGTAQHSTAQHTEGGCGGGCWFLNIERYGGTVSNRRDCTYIHTVNWPFEMSDPP